MLGVVATSQQKSANNFRNDEAANRKIRSVKKLFSKDFDELTPKEAIICEIYTELLNLQEHVHIKDPLENIRFDGELKDKFDGIHGIYHEHEKKLSMDAWFKPYFLDIKPISCKIRHLVNDISIVQEKNDDEDILLPIQEEDTDDVNTVESTKRSSQSKFYTVYDYDGDGSLDRNDFNCEYRINNKLVELTDTEIEESLEKMNNLTQNRIYEIFHNENYVDKSFGRIAAVWYWFIMVCVSLSLAAYACSTVEVLMIYRDIWHKVEMIATVILTLEYIITFFMVRNKHHYVLCFQNVIDFLAILPFYLQIIIQSTTGRHFVTVEALGNCLRTLRILRLFKTRSLSNPYVLLMVNAVKNFLVGTGFAIGIIVAIVCLFLGSLMFASEHWNEDSGFGNIFYGMWFVIVTMSTVGYGDISPTTPIGYVCGLLTIVVGVTVFSMILMVTGQYYADLLNDYEHEITDIKEVLISLVNENPEEFVKILRKESAEFLYKKVEYALRCSKHNLL